MNVCVAFVRAVISTGAVPLPPGEDKPAFPLATCVCWVNVEFHLSVENHPAGAVQGQSGSGPCTHCDNMLVFTILCVIISTWF